MGINWKRKLFHILFSLFLFALYKFSEKVFFLLILSVLLILSLIWEFLRIKYPEKVPLPKLWAPLLKKSELQRVSDGTFYLLGILMSTLLVAGRDLEYLILVLGLADPLAGIVGGLYGKNFLKSNKSLPGSLTFFFCSFLIGGLYLNYPFWILVITALLLSCLEFFSQRDNFWVPFGGALFLKIINALPK
ncbi:MAG: diacylglycerol/polyprenol kinase family protein [Caldimicrobium sp.]